MAGEITVVTGFPGFITTQLLRQRTIDAPRVDFLVHPSCRDKARDLLGRLDWTGRGRVVEGDITLPDWGVSEGIRQEWAASCGEVHHLAAVYDLAAPSAFLEKVNVQGTGHVLRLLEGFRNLQRLIYYSTCFVSGRRPGRILEEELRVPEQGFKNAYEETKFRAEEKVRKHLDRIPTVIIRPSIVAGESTTGWIPKYDGIYFFIRFFTRLQRIPGSWSTRLLPYLGQGQCPLWLVPVDYLCSAIGRIVARPESLGKTFQIADPAPVTVREIYEALTRRFAGGTPAWRVPLGLARGAWTFPGIGRLTGIPAETLDYFGHDVHYESANTACALAGSGITCPPVMSYFDRMVDFVRRYPDPSRIPPLPE